MAWLGTAFLSPTGHSLAKPLSAWSLLIQLVPSALPHLGGGGLQDQQGAEKGCHDVR